MGNASEQAAAWLGRGFAPIPIPFGVKAPGRTGWTELRITEASVPDYFNGAPQNVGALLGEPSGGRVCVDLDAPEALALAGHCLPRTGLVGGRPGNPGSHRFYLLEGPVPATRRYDDPLARGGEGPKARLCELLSTGAQVIVEGQHPSGEPYRVEADGAPATVDADDLVARLGGLAAGALLARYWPASGRRHDATLALAGGLLRGGWAPDRAAAYVESIARAAGDEESRARVRDVVSTAARLADDQPATGWATLSQLVGEPVVRQVRAWLQLDAPAVRPTPPPLAAAPWPAPLAAEAYHGLAGALVRAIEPHTEADPVALLVPLLVGFGNAIGRSAYFRTEEDRHYPNEYVAIVGKSSRARKGTAMGHVRRIMAAVDEGWEGTRILSGLSSGEGFAYAVRDPQTKRVPIKREGRATGEYEDQVIDAGVQDKRLLVLEPELASVLKVMGRDGNILSPALRDAWDRGSLGTLTKNNPVRATGAHVSVIGHITVEELRRTLDATEAANGFANRFLFACAQRSKLLPEGGRVPQQVLNPLIRRLHEALTFARTVGEMERDDEARALWYDVYPALTADHPGLFGAVVARGEPHVVRLSCIYALLDQSTIIRAEHLLAALAVWQYAEESARYIFGDSTGDPTADTILAALRQGSPLARNDIVNLLGRHVSGARLDQALGLLLTAGRAERRMEPTAGRSAEVWYLRGTAPPPDGGAA